MTEEHITMGQRELDRVGVIRQGILDLVRFHYADFGPTLACEKRVECHDHKISVETLRQWMIADDLWKPRARRQARIHQRRPHRPCRGGLVQIDGSPHDRFEGRGPRCTLIVFIDDATSELLAQRFAPAETTRPYLETLGGHLAQHGRPVALYSGKHRIFRDNHPPTPNENRRRITRGAIHSTEIQALPSADNHSNKRGHF